MSTDNQNTSGTIAIQGEAKPAEATKSFSMFSSLADIVPLLLIFAVFYFLVFRPQEKRRRQQQELIGGVKKGEEVILNSGIFATITRVHDDGKTIDVEIGKDVIVKVLKSAISDIIRK